MVEVRVAEQKGSEYYVACTYLLVSFRRLPSAREALCKFMHKPLLATKQVKVHAQSSSNELLLKLVRIAISKSSKNLVLQEIKDIANRSAGMQWPSKPSAMPAFRLQVTKIHCGADLLQESGFRITGLIKSQIYLMINFCQQKFLLGISIVQLNFQVIFRNSRCISYQKLQQKIPTIISFIILVFQL